MTSADQGDAAVFHTPWSKQFATPVRAFLQTSSGSAGILTGAIVVAVVWANLGTSYESVWTTPFGIRLGDASVTRDLRTWVNSGLMTLFFLVVGLEIKREFTVGHLASRRSAALPVAAAIGGMVAPALIYSLIIGPRRVDVAD